MNVRTVVTFLVIAIGLTAYAIRFEGGDAPWQGAGMVFSGIEPSDIVWLEIDRRHSEEDTLAGAGASKIVLERIGESEWEIVDPIQFGAFLPRVQGVLWGITDMVKVHEIPAGSTAHSSWAPENGSDLVVRFRTHQGAEHRIEIGLRHPQIDKDLYARVDGEDGAVIVTRYNARAAFTTSLNELRSRALFPIAPQDCLHVSVKSSKGRADKSMSRVEGSSLWRFDDASPLAGHLVDIGVLRDALVALNSWRVETFEDDVKDDPVALSASGLDRPRMVIEGVHHRNGVTRLEIGNTMNPGEDERVWVRRSADGSVFTARSGTVDLISKEAARFRTRNVFEFEGEEIVRLECTTRDGRFIVSKKPTSRAEKQQGLNEERWIVEDVKRGETFDADVILLREALQDLHHTLIEKFLKPDDAAAAESFDVGKHVGQVDILLQSGGQHSVRFFGLATDEAFAKLRAFTASRSGDASRFLVVSRWPQRLFVGSYVFRDRAISTLEPSTVNEIVVSAGKQSWRLARLGNQWGFTSDQHVVEGEKLDESLLNNVVQALHPDRFRVFSFAPDLPKKDYVAYGIGKTDFYLRIQITDVKGHTDGFRTLTVGTVQEIDGQKELHFARCETIPIAFTLRADVARRLEKLVAHLRVVTGEQ
jgi:hypothetical protein